MEKKERLYYLDFIRVFSMFSIIIFHFNITARAHNVYNGADAIVFHEYLNGNLAHIGVALFFIISGVGLAYNYGDKDKLDIRSYYKKRWLGIFPMFYLAWCIGILFYFFRYYSLNPFCVKRERWTIVLTLLGMDGYMADIVPNYYILGEWFLGCIILMYIFFPLLLWVRNKIGITRLLMAYTVVYIIIVQFYNTPFQIDKFVFTRMLDFIFGMFVVEKLNKIKWFHILPAGLILVVWLCVYLNINQMYKITIFGMALFIILMYIGQLMGKHGNIVFSKLSKYSYAVFLVHHIVLDQICTWFDGRNYSKLETYCVLVICIIVTLVCARLLYKLNEKFVSFFRHN